MHATATLSIRMHSACFIYIIPLCQCPYPGLITNGTLMEKFSFDTGKLAIITVERGRMVIELDINL